MPSEYKTYYLSDLGVSEEDLPLLEGNLRSDRKVFLNLLEKISQKEKGLTNIATFADLKDVKWLNHVKSDYSQEYLHIETKLCEFPKKELRNDGTSSNPLDFDYDYLYPIQDEVDPPVSFLGLTDVQPGGDRTKKDFPSHTGYLYGTVKTFNCEPQMKCPTCKGSKTCVTCCGRGEVRCSTCNGTGDCWKCGGRGVYKSYDGYKDCYICDGKGKCPDCQGRAWFRCPDCHGTRICSRCKGEGIVTCTRCQGSGYYQTIMSFRANRYAQRLHYPSMESDMGSVIRSSHGENPATTVLRQWKNCRTVQPDQNYSMGEIGFTDENVEKEFVAIVSHYHDNLPFMGQVLDSDIPYRDTWSTSVVTDVVVEYGVCGEDYSVHIIKDNGLLAFTSFPSRLTLFDENGQAIEHQEPGWKRELALAKLAAYIFKADGMDLAEARMMDRICQTLGYSNMERWRLLRRLEKLGRKPFSALKKEIAPVLRSKKTLCFVWHCIAIDNEVTDKELAVFNQLLAEYKLGGEELARLKAFTESKFANLPDDQIVKEYVDSTPRSVSIRKTGAMILSGIALAVSILCQFVYETDDLFTFALLPISFVAFLLNIPFKRQKVYTAKRPLFESRPLYLYLLMLAGIIFSIVFYYSYYY